MEPPKVTPVMQSSMRTTQAKALKRGRKKGTGKGSRGRKAPKGRSKLKVIKDRKTKAKTEKQGQTRGKAAPSEPKKTKGTRGAAKKDVSKASQSKGRKSKQSSEHQQGRVANGKTWAYEVLPGQKLGCCACRFIFNGCSTCRKAGFKGKTPQTMRSEQLQVKEGEWAGEDWGDETGASDWAEGISDKKRKSSKKK